MVSCIGLYYLTTRFYDYMTGRFLNADVPSICFDDGLKVPEGCNLYSYCLNNPIMNVDPSGHMPLFTFLIFCVGLIAGAAVGGNIAYKNAVDEGKQGSSLFWDTVGGILLGGAIGIATAGILMAASAAMYSAIAYSAFGIVDITIAGVQSSKIIAAGLAAYNIFGAAVAPLVGITVDLIEWGQSYEPSKPKETPKHPSAKDIGYFHTIDLQMFFYS